MEQNFFDFEAKLEEPVIVNDDDDERRTPNDKPHIYTISEITKQVRNLLENTYSDIWVTGEVSNLRNPQARNYYFNLKDDQTQIRAVIFGGRSRLKFDLEDGQEVVAHGRMAVYSVRGEYQIIVDYCEPKGKGALQVAFEQLKKKLEQEGLFADERKRAIPFLPHKVGVITSPTGAAVRDIINVLTRRFPNIEILLIPVKVQGDGAAQEVANAIDLMNQRDDVDVMIVGRGGGSLEDLWAFNEEIVARSIFSSRIPVVSAVGHQIDYTISDFVADVRAPTPSAAAELVVPRLIDLQENIKNYQRQLKLAIKHGLKQRWDEVQRCKSHISDPSRRFPDLYIRLDSLMERLKFVTEAKINNASQHIDKLTSNLTHLSPKHILEKGYAVVTKAGANDSISSAKMLSVDQDLKIRFLEGSVAAKVTKNIDE